MSELWVEKHRPQSVTQIKGQAAVVQRLGTYAGNKNFPHLLFAGPPGTGKTTAAMALTKDIFGQDFRQNLLEMNASDERKLESIRTKVKQFARTQPYGCAAFKIIFLDEADALTNDAQGALRRIMEQYAETCRFILSCNYSSKIIEPIQSRCAVFRFRPLSDADVARSEREAPAEIDHGGTFVAALGDVAPIGKVGGRDLVWLRVRAREDQCLGGRWGPEDCAREEKDEYEHDASQDPNPGRVEADACAERDGA